MKNFGGRQSKKNLPGKIFAILFMVFLAVVVYGQSETKTGDLDKYLGVYSTVSVPLKFTISKKGNQLFTRGTGQAELALAPAGPDVYKNEKMGMVIEFNPAKQQFTLKQSGQVFLYKRDLVQRPEPDFIEKDGK